MSDIGKARGEGNEALTARLTQLKESGAHDSLIEWRTGYTADEETYSEMREPLLYLEKREAHLNYPDFTQSGWPIGSGSVESANKVGVQARMKGSGMHWKRENVNPMLCLRNALCSDRWEESDRMCRAR